MTEINQTENTNTNTNTNTNDPVVVIKTIKRKKTKLVIVEDDTNDFDTYTILTEEVPSQDEINFMLSNVLQIPNILFENTIITPVYVDNKFKGRWCIQGNNFIITIKLFKGESSCADYLLFKGDVNDDVSAESAICILESTKTNDTNSRNTAVNQRITKFMVYKQLYPNSHARMIMFYNNKWEQKSLSDTGIFGLKLMKSLNIEAYHGDNNLFENLYDLYCINNFNAIEEMVEEKNKIKEKKGNVSVKINIKEGANYHISCKLDKGVSASCGKISHDPNVGLLCGLINFIHNKNSACKIIIEKHNINQDYFNKLPKSKFWYSINEIDVAFDGITIVKRPELPNKYFTIENSCTEKISTILLTQIIDKKYSCIFSNHSGCALTNIKTKTKGHDIIVERTMHRPDILFYDETENALLIIEGKIEKDINLGINQLKDSNLDRFIQLIKLSYPNSTIKKGLCITIDNIANVDKYKELEFPVLFAVDLNGAFYYNV
jgi:hypothetical protein